MIKSKKISIFIACLSMIIVLELIILTLSFTSCLPNSYDDNNINNMRKISIKEVADYNKKANGWSSYQALQGGCFTKNSLVLTTATDTGVNNPLFIFDKKTYQLKSGFNNPVLNNSFGHANDITYNPKTNQIVINDWKKIHFLNADTFEFIRTITLSRSYHAISYDTDNDQYVLIAGLSGVDSMAYVYDCNFNELRSFKISTNLTRQGSVIKDSLLYYIGFENGSPSAYQSVYDGVLDKYANAIFVYDIRTGKHVNTLYIQANVVGGGADEYYGELEDLDFDGDKMVLWFNHNWWYNYAIYEVQDDIFDPNVQIDYSSTNLTNENVIVTIKANEQIKDINGWNLSTDKKTLTKSYSSNVNENITVYDLAGNKTSVVISISNIDKSVPKISIGYSTSDKASQVSAVITSNKEMQSLKDWTLSSDKKTMTKVYSENVNKNITVYDVTGNSSIINVKITNIDKISPKVSIKYGEVSKNGQEVSIISNEEIRTVNGWNLSNDKLILKKKFTSNCVETVVIYDYAGNKTTTNITINGIDKDAPQLSIKYNILEEKKLVEVVLTSNKPIQLVNGWMLSNNNTVLTKTYEKNIQEDVVVNDSLGNKTIVKINVSNIDDDILNTDDNIIESNEKKETIDNDSSVNVDYNYPKKKSVNLFSIIMIIILIILIIIVIYMLFINIRNKKKHYKVITNMKS